MVIKRDGRRQAFDRTRILNGLIKACEKRPVSVESIEAVVDDIEHDIRKKYDREISSKDIGEMVMTRLSVLDEVAYVRFASVYRQFKDVNQFMSELQTILTKNKLKKFKKQKGRFAK
jgi:transcriptional repressor NrdR